MFAPLILLVIGQVVPPQPLVPTGPLLPLQPTVAGPSAAQSPAPYSFPADSPRLERSVLTSPTRAAGEVRPAVANVAVPIESSTPAPPVTASPAARLIRDAWKRADDGTIAGEPTSLLTTLQFASTNSQRLEIVDAYWRLATGAAELGWAVDDLGHWEGLDPPAAEHGKLRLQAARAGAAADRRQAELRLTRAQYRVAVARRIADADRLPLPSDPPYVGRYETRWESISAGVMPLELKQIDVTLPGQRELIEQRAEVVTAHERSRDAAQRAYAEGQAALSELVAVQTELTRVRAAFLESVYRYNEDIARYAFGVAAEGMTAETIVSMLIPTEPRLRSVLVSPSGVRQATAIVPEDTPAFREVP